jgi:hypothetical protein
MLPYIFLFFLVQLPYFNTSNQNPKQEKIVELKNLVYATTMAETAKKKGHIVMIPFMAHGHLIPFLALARKIQETTNSFTITIATTPLNIQHLKSAISTTISSINLAELSFNHSQHGLPPNIENTEKLPLTDVIKLFHASTSLETPLSSLISKIIEQEGQPPLCIISDVFLGWVTNVAKSLGTRNITFTTCGAYGTMAYISIWSNLPHRKTDSHEFWVPGITKISHLFVTCSRVESLDGMINIT